MQVGQDSMNLNANIVRLGIKQKGSWQEQRSKVLSGARYING